jgi:hypothetical protein
MNLECPRPLYLGIRALPTGKAFAAAESEALAPRWGPSAERHPLAPAEFRGEKQSALGSR